MVMAYLQGTWKYSTLCVTGEMLDIGCKSCGWIRCGLNLCVNRAGIEVHAGTERRCNPTAYRRPRIRNGTISTVVADWRELMAKCTRSCGGLRELILDGMSVTAVNSHSNLKLGVLESQKAMTLRSEQE